jgi:hypothetical protein
VWLNPHRLPPYDELGLPANYVDRLQACLIAMHCAFKASVDTYMPKNESTDTHIWESHTDVADIKLVFTRESPAVFACVELAVLDVHQFTKKNVRKMFRGLIQYAVAVNCHYTHALFMLDEVPDTFKLKNKLDVMTDGPRKFTVRPDDWEGKFETLFEISWLLVPRGPQSPRYGALYDVCYRKCYMAAVNDTSHVDRVEGMDAVTAEFQKLCLRNESDIPIPSLDITPFTFLDLDEWVLPSAHDLNNNSNTSDTTTKKGGFKTMVQQRNAHLTKDNAKGYTRRGKTRIITEEGETQYVYKGELAKRWSHGYKDIEHFFQQSMNSEWVSYNYVSNLQSLFRRMFYACYAQFWTHGSNIKGLGSLNNEDLQWDAISDVLYVQLRIRSKGTERSVTVDAIVVRDCAEGFGLFRLALAEIVRICKYFRVHLLIFKNVTPFLRSTLKLSYGGLSSTPENSHGPDMVFEILEMDKALSVFNVVHLINRRTREKIPGFQIRNSIRLTILDLVKGWIFAQPQNEELKDVYARMREDCKQLKHVTNKALNKVLKGNFYVYWDGDVKGVVRSTLNADEAVTEYMRDLDEELEPCMWDKIKFLKQQHPLANFSGEQIFHVLDRPA